MNVDKLKKLLKESYITEIGDLKNIEIYKPEKVGKDKWEFNTKFGLVDVQFPKIDPNDFHSFKVKYKDYDYSNTIYNVVYSIDDVTSQITKTNYKELFKIISTVAGIIKEFIQEYSPYALLLFGIDKTGKGGSDKQKNTLYLAVASKNMPTGYRISDAEIRDLGLNLTGKILFKI